jgi:hypothetical protein
LDYFLGIENFHPIQVESGDSDAETKQLENFR